MIICIKLCTGEELIGQTDSDILDDIYINLTDVLQIVADVDEGYYSLHFAPWMPYTEENLYTFRRRDIITILTPSARLLAKYEEYLEPEELEIDPELLKEMKDLYDSLRSRK